MSNLGQNLGLSQAQAQRLELSQAQRLGLEILQKNAMELQTEINHQLQLNPMLVELQSPGLVYENELPGGEETPPSREEREREEDAEEYLRDVVEKLPDPENIGEKREGEGDSGTMGRDEASHDDGESARLSDETDVAFEEEERSWSSEDEERRQHFFDSYSQEDGFLELLLRECEGDVEGDEQFRELCRKLCYAVDEAGYLQGTDEELCEQTGATPEELHRAIEAMQTLDPPGICARNLQECLLLQLKRQRLVGSLEWDIVSKHLEDLERNRLPKIAKEIDCDVDEVQEAVFRIRKLHPTPGSLLHSEAVPTVLPDVFLERDAKGIWSVRYNASTTSLLGLDETYMAMLEEKSADKDTLKYLREHRDKAEMLIKAIGLRQSTIEKVATQLLLLQTRFFETGHSSDLVPLTLARVAEKLELSESTISRAIAGKNLWTPWGVFSFKSFFSTGYHSETGEEVSSLKVRKRIKEIIAAEDPRHPISDQDISNRLQQEGYVVKRRTIAKYRDLDGIPTTSQRRVHG
ncbi:MAG: RNA polymerase factor sigma-54 [Lentisphaeria bacterium]|nr:RNA polymerase factor sigma-54 [Lentisphaeria bacterium]